MDLFHLTICTFLFLSVRFIWGTFYRSGVVKKKSWNRAVCDHLGWINEKDSRRMKIFVMSAATRKGKNIVEHDQFSSVIFIVRFIKLKQKNASGSCCSLMKLEHNAKRQDSKWIQFFSSITFHQRLTFLSMSLSFKVDEM